ncbi:MAG: hypothetical protein LBR08_07775 [Bacteroidales bacterium]|jgi:3-hydroxyacyl-[acyl-carrier-protein] dehydratase|nr:hypothetical protein [Bacteroidales bacterium]
MKLKDDFFKLIATRADENGVDCHIRLNAAHPIYEAHFPGNPVTPGVCIIQMVKELSEFHRQKELFLYQAPQVRFLNILHPALHNDVHITLSFAGEERRYRVTAAVSCAEVVFAKLSVVLTEEPPCSE